MGGVELGDFSGPCPNPGRLKTLDGGRMSPKKEVTHSGGQARTSAHSAPPPTSQSQAPEMVLVVAGRN